MMFPRVSQFLSLLCLMILVSCGPETILLRPSLDSPAQHVDNGYKLMAYGKTEAAMREFKRSIELDENYSPAYVGLGIVYGMQGELVQGRTMIEKAKTLARSEEQRKEVEMGFERLDFIEKNSQQ
jgi:Tfp pilus assembly protein PilF